MDTKDIALSTSDNPYNPITNFDEWFEFDYKEKGYNTCQYLASIANTGEGLSDDLNLFIINRAIDEIVDFNLIGLITNYEVNYIKVTA